MSAIKHKQSEKNMSSNDPSQDYEALIKEISVQHPSLSKRLKQIASFALEHPTAMALETIANIAHGANVHPSAIIRFANFFGYSGFSEMQKVFQEHVAAQSAGYKERIRKDLSQNKQSEPYSPHSLLKEYCEANIVSMKNLQDGISVKDLDKAIKMINSASQVYIIGQRRSFPIATYLTYSLSRVDCRAHLMDGTGGMLTEQAKLMRNEDLLIAISFHPYSEDTSQIALIASKKKIPCIAISDSKLSPIAEKASLYLAVHDAEVHSFRSLNASMCLAQTLATSLVFRDKRTKLRKNKSSK